MNLHSFRRFGMKRISAILLAVMVLTACSEKGEVAVEEITATEAVTEKVTTVTTEETTASVTEAETEENTTVETASETEETTTSATEAETEYIDPAEAGFILATDSDGRVYLDKYTGDGGRITIPSEAEYVGISAFLENSNVIDYKCEFKRIF